MARFERMADQPVLQGEEFKLFQAACDDKKNVGAFLNAYPEKIGSIPQLLEGSDLSDLNLNFTKFTEIKVPKNSLQRTIFTKSELERTDFSGFKLYKSNFTEAKLTGANFTGANLLGAYFDRACIEKVNFTGANLNAASFENTDGIRMVNFQNATMLSFAIEDNFIDSCNFNGAGEILSLKDSEITDTDLSGLKVGLNDGLAGTTFVNCSLNGLIYEGTFNAEGSNPTFDGLNMNNAVLKNSTATVASFVDTKLMGVDFRGATLTKSDFTKAKLQNGIFSGAILDECDFDHTHITNANFSSANFTGATITNPQNSSNVNFSEAVMKKVTFTSSVFANSNFSGVDFSGAKFQDVIFQQRSNLVNTIFTGATLKNVDFSDSNLTGANLAGVNLTGATLSGANLTNADLRNADLTGVDLNNTILKGIKTNKNTKMDMSFGRKLRKFITRKGTDSSSRIASRYVSKSWADEDLY